MTEVKFKKFEWDWKEAGPDWIEINIWIQELGTQPYFYRYDTDNDSYGVLVADKKLMDIEVDLLVEED
jgi:hypothetical protein